MTTELRAWWRSLDARPSPLSRAERGIVWILALLAAATRPLAVARTLWDWDEALFCLALRDYDVVLHHPHPPGFPLFIATAKAVMLTTGASDFHALQAIAVAASVLVFPAMFLLARELRATFFASSASALLLAFTPNVWFFGGTAFSDVPSMVLSLAACALLLRGVRSRPALFGGAIVTAVAAGFRPQNLLICLLPAIVVLVRRPRATLVAAVLGASLVTASYGGAVAASGGWHPYAAALAKHQQYIRATDSFLAAGRPSLWQVADDFWLRPYRVPFANATIVLFAAVGLLRRRASAVAACAIFGPFLLFAWLMLDYISSSRFSVAWVPLYALLAAMGMELVPRVRSALVAAFVLAVGIWMLEPLSVVRETESPPVRAAAYIRARYRDRPVLVDPRVVPLAEQLLGGLDLRIGTADAEKPAVAFREFASDSPGATNFVRPPGKLARVLTRPRYFAMSVVPLPAGRR